MASIQMQKPNLEADQITHRSQQVQKPCEKANNKPKSSKKYDQPNTAAKVKEKTMEVMKGIKEHMHLHHHSKQTQQPQINGGVPGEHQKHNLASGAAKKKETDEVHAKKNEHGHFNFCNLLKTHNKKEKNKKKKNIDKDGGTSSSSESENECQGEKKKQEKEKHHYTGV